MQIFEEVNEKTVVCNVNIVLSLPEQVRRLRTIAVLGHGLSTGLQKIPLSESLSRLVSSSSNSFLDFSPMVHVVAVCMKG